MSKQNKPWILIGLLIPTLLISFLLPKPKYTGLNILEKIAIPSRFEDWTSIDVSKELNLKDDRYNFISDVFARLYRNRYGEDILFLILDAGNFHNPKVCYTSSGFSVKELGNVDFQTQDTLFKATSLFMKKQSDALHLFYWLCIDKRIVSWTGQKVQELFSSLSNHKKAGLMVRLEIPNRNRTPEQSFSLGQSFIHALNRSLSTEQKEYLFGKSL